MSTHSADDSRTNLGQTGAHADPDSVAAERGRVGGRYVVKRKENEMTWTEKTSVT